MDKELFEKLKNLRNGIAVGAAAVTMTAVSEPVQAQEKENPQKIEVKTQEKVPLTQGTTFLAEEEFLYNLHYENGSVHYNRGDTIIDLAEQIKDPQQTIKEQKSDLKNAYDNLKDDDLFKEGSVLINKEGEFSAAAQFSFKDKSITINDVEYSDKYIRLYIIDNVLDDEDRLKSISQQMGVESPEIEEMKDFLKVKLESALNSPEAKESARQHESQHRDNDRNGGNLAGISPLQYASEIQTDEISANIKELLYQREQYIKTGDIEQIKLGFYKEAVLSKEVVPGSKVKELENADFGLIMNGMQDHWKDKWQESYHPQLTGLAKQFAEKNGVMTIAPNEKELQRREKNALSFEINGKEVDLTQFRKERLPLTDEVKNEVSKAFMDKLLTYTPENIKIAQNIKSEEQLNKMKLEKCSGVNDRVQKSKAMTILEKQGRIIKKDQRNKINLDISKEKIRELSSEGR